MLKRFRLEKSGLPDNLSIPEALTCQNTAVDIPHEQPEQFEKQRPKKPHAFKGAQNHAEKIRIGEIWAAREFIYSRTLTCLNMAMDIPHEQPEQ